MQYIAELYANFCYLGIAIFNFILGIVIALFFSVTIKMMVIRCWSFDVQYNYVYTKELRSYMGGNLHCLST